MSKLENLQICIKDGEVIALQGLDTVTADRLEDPGKFTVEELSRFAKKFGIPMADLFKSRKVCDE